MKKILFILLISYCSNTFSQQFKIEGKITNGFTRQELSYANLRVANSTIGTSANIEGNYLLNLNEGKFALIASYIGFKSDTIIVNLKNNLHDVNFSLIPVAIKLPEVTVIPGKNPALEIIKRAIDRKHTRAELINSYEFDAYTKGIIRTNNDLGANSNSVSIGTNGNSDDESDTLKINAILENQSKGYYKKPGKYKEFIVAQKQSSNLPSSINVLTGGRIIQSFYSDDIRFFNRPLTGPISDNALDYYYFYIVDTLAIDNQNVFKIYFAPDNESDPGFQGHVFITDVSFDLIKVDVELNRAANLGGLFEHVNIFQQFLSFDDIYMPIDYRLFVKANILGLVKIGFEINSILHNYLINPAIKDDFFDMAILTVLPEADKKDSSYWKRIQIIPNTIEELQAYKIIDSLESVPHSFWDDFPGNLLSTSLSIHNNLSVTAPLGLYHFNRIEGNTLNFGISAYDLINKRMDFQLKSSYGFADKKFKPELNFKYLFGDYRDYSISFNAFKKLAVLFPESDNYNELTSTLLALISKYEYRNYYYTEGLNFNLAGKIFPALKMEMEFINHVDKTALNNSDFSIFAKDKKYKLNPPVYDSKINAVKIGFGLDFRKYIEDGYYRRRVSQGKSYILLAGSFTFSNSKLLNSDLNFTRFDASVSGVLNTFNSAKLKYDLSGTFSDGPVPYQMFYSLPGNINAISQNFTFRTLNVGDFFGDKVLTAKLEHEFGDELFRMSRIPVLKDLELQLTSFFNAAWLDISEKSKGIIPVDFNTLKNPLFEAGFNIGHVLFPIKLELSWRLNHREKNNFVIGINTPIL